MRDRVALVRAGLRLKRAVAGYERVAEPRAGETPADTRRRVLAYGDDRTFADWLGPLSGDAAALFRATVTRSTAELDQIAFGHGAGYFSLVWNAGKGLSYNVLGGPGRLIDGSRPLSPTGWTTRRGAEIVHRGRPRTRPLSASREPSARYSRVTSYSRRKRSTLRESRPIFLPRRAIPSRTSRTATRS